MKVTSKHSQKMKYKYSMQKKLPFILEVKRKNVRDGETRDHTTGLWHIPLTPTVTNINTDTIL